MRETHAVAGVPSYKLAYKRSAAACSVILNEVKDLARSSARLDGRARAAAQGMDQERQEARAD
jgi:hypothetical protein